MKLKHTPGKWKARQSVIWSFNTIIKTDKVFIGSIYNSKNTLTTDYPSSSEADSNKKLICAAPKMYKLLQKYRASYAIGKLLQEIEK